MHAEQAPSLPHALIPAQTPWPATSTAILQRIGRECRRHAKKAGNRPEKQKNRPLMPSPSPQGGAPFASCSNNKHVDPAHASARESHRANHNIEARIFP
jgi:hypothetical protein